MPDVRGQQALNAGACLPEMRGRRMGRCAHDQRHRDEDDSGGSFERDLRALRWHW